MLVAFSLGKLSQDAACLRNLDSLYLSDVINVKVPFEKFLFKMQYIVFFYLGCFFGQFTGKISVLSMRPVALRHYSLVFTANLTLTIDI